MQDLENVKISRTYAGMSLSQAIKKDVCIFSDASEMAISAVIYLRLTDKSGIQQLGFVLGKAKLAPKHGHSIPRLELCAAVLATELYEIVRSELNFEFDSVQFFTDSRVVLGYIHNQSKRFFTYVANRVERIRRCSEPCDWNYVPSKLNPADEATRSVTASKIQDSLWLKGPTKLLCNVKDNGDDTHDSFPLVDPDIDCEVRTFKTDALLEKRNLGSSRFERFSSWNRLVIAFETHCCFKKN